MLVTHNSVQPIGSATERLLSQTDFSQHGGNFVPREQEIIIEFHRQRSTIQQPFTITLIMKKKLIRLSACLFLAVLAGCGKSEAPPTQQEADAVVFERTCARVSSLIADKDYPQARSTLDMFKNYKLTEEQKKIVDKLEAQIPKAQ
jgi:hypothetical protein